MQVTSRLANLSKMTDNDVQAMAEAAFKPLAMVGAILEDGLDEWHPQTVPT